MTTPLKISIAMTAYNCERFVAEQLGSYLTQTRLPHELIVGDDASTDCTIGIVRDFAKRAPFRVDLNINEHNLGIAKNFEQVISKCTGDIIILSDCDDVWLPHKLQRIADVFRSEASVGLIVSNSSFVDIALKPLGVTALDEAPRRLRHPYGYHLLNKGADAGRYLIQRNVLCLSHNMALRTSSLPLILPFPKGLESIRNGGHDLFIAGTLFPFVNVAIIAEPLALYRRHPDQATAVTPVGMLQRLRALLEPWGADLLLSQLDVRELVYSRIRAKGVKDKKVLGLIRAKNNFDRNRLQRWKRGRGSRAPLVCKELLLGRYHRLANGFSTVGKDFLVRPCASN